MTTGRAARSEGASGTARDSLGYLLARAALVEQRVRELVAERRAADPAPDDPFAGSTSPMTPSTSCLGQPPQRAS